MSASYWRATLRTEFQSSPRCRYGAGTGAKPVTRDRERGMMSLSGRGTEIGALGTEIGAFQIRSGRGTAVSIARVAAQVKSHCRVTASVPGLGKFAAIFRHIRQPASRGGQLWRRRCGGFLRGTRPSAHVTPRRRRNPGDDERRRYGFFAVPAEAPCICCLYADTSPPLDFLAGHFLGFFGSRFDRFCPLAM